MLVASIVVETQPGKAGTVAGRMAHIRGMGSLAAEGDHRVVATWKVPDSDTADGLCEVLHAMNPEIIEVCPTMVGEED
jgi:hypothetical protein